MYTFKICRKEWRDGSTVRTVVAFVEDTCLCLSIILAPGDPLCLLVIYMGTCHMMYIHTAAS